MPAVDLYDSHYANLGTDAQSQVRRETYGEDLGQTSWITVAEAREHLGRLGLSDGDELLEVACGSGGLSCLAARETGARCVGIDVNVGAVEAASARARQLGLVGQVSFRTADAARPLPFADGSFDAVFCNDSINHFPGRAAVLGEWRRVLRPGGRVLYTDPIVVTGQISNEEVRVRSSIGFFLFTPAGVDERLLAEAGLEVVEVRDLTAAVAAVSQRWRAARARRREALVALEGEAAFDGLQGFLDAVHALAAEGRLSRFAYLARKR